MAVAAKASVLYSFVLKKYASVNGIKKLTLFKRNCLLEEINLKILYIYIYMYIYEKFV